RAAAGLMHDRFPLPDARDALIAPFWTAAARGELAIPRCNACGALVWYPRPRCPACAGGSLTWTPVSGRGRLFAWTVVRHPFLPQFRERVPFVAGLVALDEDPAVRVVTDVVDCEPDDLEPDMPVEVVFRTISFPGVDAAVVAPLFRPRR